MHTREWRQYFERNAREVLRLGFEQYELTACRADEPAVGARRHAGVAGVCVGAKAMKVSARETDSARNGGARN